MRRYGLAAFQPCGNILLASSSDTDPAMITSSPCFQFAGGGHLMLGRELQSVDYSQHFKARSASGSSANSKKYC